MASAKRFLSLFKFIIGWPLGILALLFIAKFLIEDSSILLRFRNINLPILLLSIITLVVYYFLRVYAWKRMMTVKGYDLPLNKVGYAWELSEIIRFVPGQIWSIISRVNLFENLGVPKKVTGKVILWEIEILITSCVIISLFSLPLTQQYVGAEPIYVLYAFTTLTIFLVMIIVFGSVFLKGRIASLLPGFGVKENFVILALYTTIFFLFSTSVYLISSSILGLKFDSFFMLVGFFTFAFLVGYISPITPGGIGLREAIITFGLASIFSVSIAGLIAIFSRVVLVVTELFFLAFTSVWRKTK